VQPRLFVEILTLKPQVLLDVAYSQRINLAPSLVRRLPDNAAINGSHFQRRADLVGVEVVELLFGLTLLLIYSR